MDASELRIGNWVNYYGDSHTVTSIHRGGNVSVRLNDGDFDSEKTGLSYLQPILITEEWLERLRLSNYTFSVNGNQYFIRKIGNTWFLYLRVQQISTTEKIDVFIKSFKYVHSFQNLYFALTGEELTVNYPPTP